MPRAPSPTSRRLREGLGAEEQCGLGDLPSFRSQFGCEQLAHGLPGRRRVGEGAGLRDERQIMLVADHRAEERAAPDPELLLSLSGHHRAHHFSLCFHLVWCHPRHHQRANPISD